MGTTLASDSFPYDDGTLLSACDGWETTNSYPRIYDGGVAGNSYGLGYRTDVTETDYSVSAVIDRKSDPSAGSGYLGITARYIDDSNYLYMWARYESASSSATVQVKKVIAGTETILYSAVRTLSTESVFKIEVDGQVVTAYKDDTEIGSWELGEGELETGVPGVKLAWLASTSGYPRLDDFLVESLTTTASALKAYISEAWVQGTLKVFTGGAWVAGVLKRFNGTDWA